MGRPKKILWKEDKSDGVIYVCPYCHRYLVLTGKGIHQCFVCGGFVDTSESEPCPDTVKRIKYDGLRPWCVPVLCRTHGEGQLMRLQVGSGV